MSQPIIEFAKVNKWYGNSFHVLRDIDLQVDGGITRETAPWARAAGADVFVAGNAVFGASDYGAAMRVLRDAAEEAR